MNRFSLLGITLLMLSILPGSASAQQTASGQIQFSIPGFSEVSSSQQNLPFALDPSSLMATAQGEVRYETNKAQQTVYVHVEGDLMGLELRIEPQGANVIGMARTGTPGVPQPVTFSTAGTLPLVTGIVGAGVDMPVSYTLVSTDPTLPINRTLQISYSMDPGGAMAIGLTGTVTMNPASMLEMDPARVMAMDPAQTLAMSPMGMIAMHFARAITARF